MSGSVALIFRGKRITYFGCRDCGKVRKNKNTLRPNGKWCNQDCRQFVLAKRSGKSKKVEPATNGKYQHKCVACGSKGRWHNHHITYNPEATVRLCLPCHYIITSLNTEKRGKVNRTLTNDERLAIYHCFVRDRRHHNKILTTHLKNGEQIFRSYKKSNDLNEEFVNIVSA